MPFSSAVSVIVPVYEGAHVLPTTVPAMLAQSEPAEWLFVDDGSTDETGAVLRRLIAEAGAEDRARVLVHPENRGRAAARNTGVGEAHGRLLAFLDADVAPRPGYLTALRAALERPGVVAAVARLEVVGDRADPYVRYLGSRLRGPRRGTRARPQPWRFFRLGIAMVHAEAIRTVGGFDEALTYGEDLEAGARLAERWPDGLRFVPEACAYQYDVGDLEVACAKMAEFGRHNLPRMVERHPQLAGQTGVDVVDSASGLRGKAYRALLHPRVAHAVRRVLPHLPRGVSDYAVRYLLGFTLAHSYREGRRRRTP